ncbi:SAM-dependent DNA methyltransferase [Holdemanella biformis]|uniref:site-specific DNA-methyltransferase (adenine-specific) n=1 Tax=Holdemanella biformis TaxID=1735 RepID=A0A395WB55_9FIRM|nr:SAM-dependent DNA methyltransferase [Holdemanella biformis]RGU93358.1 SAM-dependent DNA methyltransferase [Holdemanella biformis]
MVDIKKLESDLWESADLLRAGSKLTSNQYCMPVLGLIFLRYAYSRYKKVEAEILKDRPSRGGRVMPVEASDFAEKSALFLPKEAQYEYLLNLPENVALANLKDKDGQEMNSLGAVVNNAMSLIEEQSEQLAGVLPKTYTDFSDGILSELLRIFNNSALDNVGGDVIGRIYEYFLNKFAKNVASDDGVFFTPKSLVKMIVNVIEPKGGTLLDPACGSGGMFIQSDDFVNQTGMNANNTMTFFGQEKVEYNAQLCLMNMAVHGLTGVIKSGDEANSFYHDAHNLNGKCDYVMANPPFNVDKVKAETCQSAGRLPFGLPSVNKNKEIGNANYCWINYFYSYLNNTGRAGFVMASSATDSQGNDRDIRKKLVETGHVDVMVSVGNNFFYTKSLPCSLWFFDKGKKQEIIDKVLFIDARNYYTEVDRTLNEWTEWQLKNLNAIVWLYRGETDKYLNLIKEYKTVLETDSFEDKISTLKNELKELKKEAKEKVENSNRNEKKKTQTHYDELISKVNEELTIAKEAQWLYGKFGDGEYRDVLGLCKIVTIQEIAEKGYSLTPGVYVGVAPQEDDGVDFKERIQEIHKELLQLQKESNDLMDTISQNMKEMGL